MLPTLSSFAENVVHIVTGKYLKTLVDRIKRQTPIAGANITMQETAEGIMLHANFDSLVTPTTALLYDFKATLAGTNSLTIAGGKVIGAVWGTINQDSPFPPDLLSEQFTIATQTLSVPSGSSVWLKITASTADIALTGQLSLVDSVTRTVTTGGGGAGGQGGGGGGSGDSSVSTAGQAGSPGSSAVLDTPGALNLGTAKPKGKAGTTPVEPTLVTICPLAVSVIPMVGEEIKRCRFIRSTMRVSIFPEIASLTVSSTFGRSGSISTGHILINICPIFLHHKNTGGEVGIIDHVDIPAFHHPAPRVIVDGIRWDSAKRVWRESRE